MLKDVKAIRKNLTEFKRLEFKINLIKYITSNRYRTSLFKRKAGYWKEMAENLGYYMTKNSPGELFYEVLFDKIYDVGGGKIQT